MMPFVITGDM